MAGRCRCSCCINNGHITQTRPVDPVRADIAFGGKLTIGSSSIMNISPCMGNLNLSSSSSSQQHPCSHPASPYGCRLCVSEEPALKPRPDRKKGRIPWTEQEHNMFLFGLTRLKRGDWRALSREYVITKTPTQCASHAQKHFIRRISSIRMKKQRYAFFDMIPQMANEITSIIEEENAVIRSWHQFVKPVPVLPEEPVIEDEVVHMSQLSLGPRAYHQVVKAVPVLPEEPIIADEVVHMSQLSLGPS